MTEGPRTLPSRIQERLGALYGVDAPSVDRFVSVQEGDIDREVLLVRKSRRGVEMRLCLPAASLATEGELSLDLVAQVAEGVSHFLVVAERSRRELPATQLELEIQAEVDKFLLFAGVLVDKPASRRQLDTIYGRLFEGATFTHGAGTERGERYRLANKLAAKFLRRVVRDLARGGVSAALRRSLRAFFDGGQREKIELAIAA